MSEFSEESLDAHLETGIDATYEIQTKSDPVLIPETTTRADGNEDPDKPKLGYKIDLGGAFRPVKKALHEGRGPCGTYYVSDEDGTGYCADLGVLPGECRKKGA